MKKLILILSVVSIILLPLLGLTQNVPTGIPPSAVFVGEFAAGSSCYEFPVDQYTVTVVFVGGNLRSGIVLRLLTSPDNMAFPTGYVFLYPDSETGVRKGSPHIAWRLNGHVLYFVPTSHNGCQVWVH